MAVSSAVELVCEHSEELDEMGDDNEPSLTDESADV
jgi:hypothetical protein